MNLLEPPYSPVLRVGDLVFVSGQLGRRDGALVDGGVPAQTAQALDNLAARLAEVGASLTDVVKTTCYLVDMGQFDAFNAAYSEGFGGHRPTRTTIAVREIPSGAVVEIDAIAHRPPAGT